MTDDLKSVAIGILAGAVLCYALNWMAEIIAYQSHIAALAMGAN